MKVDEAVSLAARAAMRGCDEGMNPDEWGAFADYAIGACVEAASAVRNARDAAEKGALSPAETQALRDRAFVAALEFATAALMTLAHLECLEAIAWPEELTPEVLTRRP